MLQNDGNAGIGQKKNKIKKTKQYFQKKNAFSY